MRQNQEGMYGEKLTVSAHPVNTFRHDVRTTAVLGRALWIPPLPRGSLSWIPSLPLLPAVTASKGSLTLFLLHPPFRDQVRFLPASFYFQRSAGGKGNG